MATCLYSDGIRFPDGTCQRSQGQVPGGLFQCYNDCLVCNGTHRCRAHCGRCGCWFACTCASKITFEVWSGGGSGSGHCCFSCRCDIASCGSFGGYFGKKTIRRTDGQFVPGCCYRFCVGSGGNGTSNNGCGCFTSCCDAPRGCSSWVIGSGLCCACIPGGKGAYTIYCTCKCMSGSNRTEGFCNLGICIGCKWDFASLGGEPQFYKSDSGCQCWDRWQKNAKSYGLENDHTFYMGPSRTYCGCASCCRGFRLIAMGGMSNMKSWCGNFICFCLGTPGMPGMVRITWS